MILSSIQEFTCSIFSKCLQTFSIWVCTIPISCLLFPLNLAIWSLKPPNSLDQPTFFPRFGSKACFSPLYLDIFGYTYINVHLAPSLVFPIFLGEITRFYTFSKRLVLHQPCSSSTSSGASPGMARQSVSPGGRSRLATRIAMARPPGPGDRVDLYQIHGNSRILRWRYTVPHVWP